MRDRFLYPRDDFIDGWYVTLGQVAVHLVAQPYIDTAVPKPANLHVDLAVVDILKLDGQVRNVSHDPYYLLPPGGTWAPPVLPGADRIRTILAINWPIAANFDPCVLSGSAARRLLLCSTKNSHLQGRRRMPADVAFREDV